MGELRSLLARTVPLQARFAAGRLEAALPKMLEAAQVGEREKIRTNFYRVAAEPFGPYALVDYVNFKGEGTLESERYKGEGWGLLQVLEAMGDGPALLEFRRAAELVSESPSKELASGETRVTLASRLEEQNQDLRRIIRQFFLRTEKVLTKC